MNFDTTSYDGKSDESYNLVCVSYVKMRFPNNLSNTNYEFMILDRIKYITT